jgi:hypothetical protein
MSDMSVTASDPSPTEPTPADPASAGPAPADPMERLDPRVVVYWLVSGIASLLVLAGIVGFGLYLSREHIPGGVRWAIVVASVLGAIMTVWTLVAPTLAYARWRFRIDADLLVARYGIVFHEEKAIPISRLQHVDLTRGPIERLFGLATFVVYTAGTEGASFRLPGLAAARAKELRDAILAARGDDVV